MTTKASTKLTKAKDRLKRIEDAIAPYSERAVPQTPPPRGEWMPGEYVHIRKGGEIGDRPRFRIGSK